MAVFAENKKARFDYEFLDTYEAGIKLTGQEVKSVKLGRAQLAGAYVVPQGEELVLVGVTIPPYQPNNAPDSYDPQRSRRLLLHKKEIAYLLGRVQEKGLTLVPIKLYNTKAQIKLEFALARGKRQYDKRDDIKKREAEREMKRMRKMIF